MVRRRSVAADRPAGTADRGAWIARAPTEIAVRLHVRAQHQRRDRNAAGLGGGPDRRRGHWLQQPHRSTRQQGRNPTRGYQRAPSMLGVAAGTAGFGPTMLGVAPSTLGIGPTMLGVAPGTLGIGPSMLGVAPGTLGVGPKCGRTPTGATPRTPCAWPVVTRPEPGVPSELCRP